MTTIELQDIYNEHGADHFKSICYAYSRNFDHSCILDSCQLNTGVYHGKYEFLAAFGAKKVIASYEEDVFSSHAGQWMFGVISYDLKNKFEALNSKNALYIEQEELAFFIPQTLISISKAGHVELQFGELSENFGKKLSADGGFISGLKKTNQILKESYVSKIKEIKDLIREGEVYELNYCVQHQYEFDYFDPVEFQLKLLKRSPVPMASFLKWNDRYLCGASMERFLKRDGNQLISQPIKGTIKKGKNHAEDRELCLALYHSEKDRAENVMIVDLVRNDLARVSETGSVKVDELFGIYSYLQVHQMISTVSSLSPSKSFEEVLRATFPMGSMTGAPKISAMQHIDELEEFRRGWYSGSVGYITPDGDFDLNVVIRSLISDMSHGRLVYSAGGAITIDSVPEGEWHECLLKTKAIESLLVE